MSAAYLKIELTQGEDYREVWTWYDASGALVNLSGYTALLQARSAYGAADLLIDISTTAGAHGGITLGGAAGTIEVHIEDTCSAAIVVADSPGAPPVRRIPYDLWLYAPNGDKIHFTYGPIEIQRKVRT